MSTITDFWKFIQGKLRGGKSIEVTSKDITEFIDREEWNRLALYEFALHSGINIIANALSACEVRTFKNWEEVYNNQHYLWNYEPNMNMNASQFKQKLVWSLIYKNECLIIQTRKGDFLIADSYEHEQYALYQDTFRNVTVGMDNGNGISRPYTFQKSFKMEDVLYYRLSNRNITALMNQLMDDYERLLESAVQKFYKSGGERGTVTIDANASTATYGVKEDGTPRSFNDVYRDLLNNQFKEYFKSPNAVLPLFKGFDYQTKGGETSKKSTSEIKDVTDITDEIYERVANALQIPPALLKGDVADVTALTKNLITFAIDPIAKMIETENNRKLYREEVLNGNYQMIDTSRIVHMTAAELATASDKMISCGGWNIDDIRRKAGDAPLNTEWSKKHFLTKNYEELNDLENDKVDTPNGDDIKNNEGGKDVAT
ncbi:phage portal protein [Bariatricus sp. SGI.161]|uniref:phage portal protein n=1 Tax=Bariatricus sp. SGI.161 TaxID=3420550 RepID=UPI003D02E087